MTERSSLPSPRIIAAVDLGSNSFHLMLAEIRANHFRVLHREKRKVRLAAGLDNHNNLSQESINRAVETLQAFGEVIRQSRANQVRAVGTFTFRSARNITQLLQLATPVFPHPIEILSGSEEARLIYQGVFHDQHLKQRTLVIDIGGGSTELAIGESIDPLRLHSCAMGCVSITQRHFRDHNITAERFQAAVIDCQHELKDIIEAYRKLGWKQVIGTSGSIKSLCQAATNLNLSQGEITYPILIDIRDRLIQAGTINKTALPGITMDRLPVLCGGLAILLAVFELLEVEQLSYCDAALREGLMVDVQARLDDQDIRLRSIRQLAERFGTDADFSQHVIHSTEQLFEYCREAWFLEHNDHRLLLNWAAQLMEIGLHINYQDAHLHSAYIVRNTILPGFNHDQQQALAFLLFSLRNSFKVSDIPRLSLYSKNTLLHLAAILRLAAILNRFRQTPTYPFRYHATATGLTLQFSHQWLSINCLLDADLKRERKYWRGIRLSLKWEFVADDSAAAAFPLCAPK